MRVTELLPAFAFTSIGATGHPRARLGDGETDADALGDADALVEEDDVVEGETEGDSLEEAEALGLGLADTGTDAVADAEASVVAGVGSAVGDEESTMDRGTIEPDCDAESAGVTDDASDALLVALAVPLDVGSTELDALVLGTADGDALVTIDARTASTSHRGGRVGTIAAEGASALVVASLDAVVESAEIEAAFAGIACPVPTTTSSAAVPMTSVRKRRPIPADLIP